MSTEAPIPYGMNALMQKPFLNQLRWLLVPEQKDGYFGDVDSEFLTPF